MTRRALRRHPVLRRGVIVLLVVLLVGGAAAVARAATKGPGTSFRVTTARVGSAVQTITATGTVDPSNRADVSFAVSGTVRSLQVAPGDTVAPGQTIATLERAGPKAAVEAAKADLAKARAQLEADQEAPADTVATPSATGADSSPNTGSSSRAQARLARQQQAVRSAQTAVAHALAAARAALDAQSSACSIAFQGVSSSEQDGACTAALTTVQNTQGTVAVAQDALQDAMRELADTLRKAGTDTTSPEAADAEVAGDDVAGDDVAGDDSASSASRIASDQASIDAAKAALLRARRELALTTLVAPIAGNVASVGAEPGQQVSAGDAALTIVGAGSVRIETTVAESRVRQVEVGQPARVTVVGAATSSSGTVTSVGLVPDTSSGSVDYPITVTVPGSAVSIPAGAQATVAIVIATATDVLTVPSSAVRRRGRSASVTVLESGQAVTETVQTGVVGALRTEITDGLRSGARVVLADLSQPLSGDDAFVPGLDGDVSRVERGGPTDGVGTVRVG